MGGECGLEISTVWDDEWLVEIRIVGVNKMFRGGAEITVSPDWLMELASKFRGFPASKEDRFRMEAGIADVSQAVIESFQTDSSGHVADALKVVSDDSGTGILIRSQRAEVIIPFEPAAGDRFADELELLASSREGSARLSGIGG